MSWWTIRRLNDDAEMEFKSFAMNESECAMGSCMNGGMSIHKVPTQKAVCSWCDWKQDAHWIGKYFMILFSYTAGIRCTTMCIS